MSKTKHAAGLAALALLSVSHAALAETKKDVSLVLGVKGSPFYEALACGAKAKAASMGYQLSISAPDLFQADVQIPVVDAVGAAAPALAAIVPTDGQALMRPMKALADRGIKIITVDQTLVDPSFVETQIVTDNLAGGKLAADEMNRLLGGKGKVFELAPPPGSQAQDDRLVGFEQQLKMYPGLTLIGKEFVNDDPQKAAELVTAAIAATPDLAGIFANNDQAVIGAVTGLKQAGVAGKIKLIGYDAATAEVNALKNGIISVLIAQNPKQEGELAIELADEVLKGEKLPKLTNSELVPIREGDIKTADKYEYKADCTF